MYSLYDRPRFCTLRMQMHCLGLGRVVRIFRAAITSVTGPNFSVRVRLIACRIFVLIRIVSFGDEAPLHIREQLLSLR